MSDEKFTDLPPVTNATFADIICAIQAGISVQQTQEQVFLLNLSNTILNFAGNPNGNLAGQVYQFCWNTVANVLYVCITTGNAATAVWAIVKGPSAPFSQVVVQTFYTGTSTYTPTAGMEYCIVELAGGAGSGGGVSCIVGQAAAATGGGSAGYCRKLYTAENIGISANVIVGAGGVAAISGNNPGNNGNDSTFNPSGTGVDLTAGGGRAGIGMASSASIKANSISGAGGIAVNGDLNIPGQYGTGAFVLENAMLAVNGSGGSNVLGQGGGTITFSLLDASGNMGLTGQGYGAGSAGAIACNITFDIASNPGQPGICIVTEFI